METQIKPRPVIQLIPIESSQLDKIGHCAESNTLAIQFKPTKRNPELPGSIYHYANFTAEDFAKFQAAESKGSHFKRYIKDADDKHPYERIQ